MDSADKELRKLVAFTLPMAVFLLLLALISLLRRVGGAFWLASPEYWIYPAQTIFCGALLLWFWREYQFRAARRIVFAAAVALLVFALWIAPQASCSASRRVSLASIPRFFPANQPHTGPRLQSVLFAS